VGKINDEIMRRLERDLVVDLAHVAQADDLRALGLEDLAPQALVGVGLLVDRPVVLVVEARREAPDAEVVHPAHAVGGVVAHPVLAAQLLDPVQRRARGEDPRLRFALLEVAVVLDAEDLDEPRQREPLQDQRGEDDRVGQEDDEVALREGPAAVDRLRDGQCRGQGHGTAHAGPSHDGRELPVDGGLALADPAR